MGAGSDAPAITAPTPRPTAPNAPQLHGVVVIGRPIGHHAGAASGPNAALDEPLSPLVAEMIWTGSPTLVQPGSPERSVTAMASVVRPDGHVHVWIHVAVSVDCSGL